MTTDNLMNRGLPKWPQMYTTGKSVTEDQAKEIIRRTDSFFLWAHGGNDHKWDRKWSSAFGMRHFTDYSDPDRKVDWKLRSDLQRLWNEKWNVLDLEYCTNHWLSSSYVYGPYGWCHPWRGVINFVDNVGKWPSVEEIYNEWAAIAKAFPFLDVGVTLMDGEHTEENIKPIVSMKVLGGEVTLVDPTESDVHKDHPKIKQSRDADSMTAGLFGVDREHGIRMDWMEEWAGFAKKEVIPAIEELERNWKPDNG